MKKLILIATLSLCCSGLVFAENESNLGLEIAPIGDTYLAVVIKRPNTEFMLGLGNFRGQNSSNRSRVNSTGTYTEFSSTKNFDLEPLIQARFFINKNIFVMASFETVIFNGSTQYNSDATETDNTAEDFKWYSVKGGVGVVVPVFNNVSIVTQSALERESSTYTIVSSDNETADVTTDIENTGVFYSLSYSLAVQYYF
jgi:hypothetical protein